MDKRTKKKLLKFVEYYNQIYSTNHECDYKDDDIQITADNFFSQVFIYAFMHLHNEIPFYFYISTKGDHPVIRCY